MFEPTRYYEPFSEWVSLENPESVPFFNQNRWHQVKKMPSGEARVCIRHPCFGAMNDTWFEVFGGVRYDDENPPYPRAFVSLSTKLGDKKVYAFLTVDLSDFSHCQIVWSLLPFDGNGRPQLPLEDEPMLLVAMASEWPMVAVTPSFSCRNCASIC